MEMEKGCPYFLERFNQTTTNRPWKGHGHLTWPIEIFVTTNMSPERLKLD